LETTSWYTSHDINTLDLTDGLLCVCVFVGFKVRQRRLIFVFKAKMCATTSGEGIK